MRKVILGGSMHVLDSLRERGFIQQVSDEAALRERLSRGARDVLLRVRSDRDQPARRQPGADHGDGAPARAGHRPIAVLGGGTAMVGDPSGKTEMRQMLSRGDDPGEPARRSSRRCGASWTAAERRAIVVNNADWLLQLNYIEFLRDIGRHFTVNQMLAAEAYKLRLEKGLSFIEFNYQLLQAYDFLQLFQRHGCRLQIGGDDQWGNILAGADLIRRVEQQRGVRPDLPADHDRRRREDGQDGRRRGLAGARSARALRLLPVLGQRRRPRRRPLPEAVHVPAHGRRSQRLAALEGAELRAAKQVLAFEVTTDRPRRGGGRVGAAGGAGGVRGRRQRAGLRAHARGQRGRAGGGPQGGRPAGGLRAGGVEERRPAAGGAGGRARRQREGRVGGRRAPRGGPRGRRACCSTPARSTCAGWCAGSGRVTRRQSQHQSASPVPPADRGDRSAAGRVRGVRMATGGCRRRRGVCAFGGGCRTGLATLPPCRGVGGR